MDFSSERELEALIGEAGGTAAAFSADLRFLLASPEFAELAGRKPGDIQGAPLAEILPGIEKKLQAAFEKGFHFNIHAELKRADGGSLPVEVQAAAVPGKKAAVLSLREIRKTAAGQAEVLSGFLKVIRSIGSAAGKTADRKQFLEQTCENLVRMSGYHSAWIALTDKAGKKAVLTAEYGFGVLPVDEDLKRGDLCYCMKEAMKQPSMIVIEDTLATCGSCPVSTIFGKTSSMVRRIEYAGRIYGVVNVHATPETASSRNEQDAFSEITLNIASVLHNLELEEQRAEAEIETTRARRMKADFLSLISHRLRTPLTPVNEGVSVLLEGLAGELSPEQREILSTVGRNASSLAKIVERVVALERLQNGMEPLRIGREDAGTLLEEAREGFMKQAMAKKLDIRFSPPGERLFADMDVGKIREVLRLLVSNAIRHTEKGSVELSAVKKGDTAVFSVTDTGPGIPAESLGVIFDRFETLGKRGETGGAGLGLSICREIIRLHGGLISVESAVGEGSRFFFELPLENPRRTEESPDAG